MSRVIDIQGKTFGRLRVIEQDMSASSHEAKWLCECTCGKRISTYGSGLRSGNTRSCGCLRKEIASNNFRTHGKSKERLYNAWLMMTQRTTNPKNDAYHNYGGKGIKVCEAWRDYETFRSWAYSTGYDENAPHQGCTIERIDNDGDYTPENCRWIPMSEQSRNTCRNRMLTFEGETRILNDWAKKTGIPSGSIRRRLKDGWTVEKALTVPIRKAKARYQT